MSLDMTYILWFTIVLTVSSPTESLFSYINNLSLKAICIFNSYSKTTSLVNTNPKYSYYIQLKNKLKE